MPEKKMNGDDRRKLLLNWLIESDEPLTGQTLAQRTDVSRQVIVQDISLLKARNEPIIATSQGYIYINRERKYPYKRIIACHHPPQKTIDELLIMTDYGIYVRDVTVEHPIYGEITASLRLKSRQEVYEFINKMENLNASYLSDLTDGVHLHTIEASYEKQLDDCIKALEKEGFILSKE